VSADLSALPGQLGDQLLQLAPGGIVGDRSAISVELIRGQHPHAKAGAKTLS
jgi:hypothetical protein